MRAFQADWVCPISNPPIANGVVVVDCGRIVEVGTRAPTGASTAVFDGCALLPGFINAHTHIELTLLRGFLENLPFPDWIRRLTRIKYELLGPQDLDVSARLGAIEMLSAGVTMVGDVMDAGTGWKAMAAYGLGGVAYQEVFGPSAEVAEAAVEELERKIRAHRPEEHRIRRIGVSPHAPYTVSAPLYRLVRDVAEREGLPVAVHVGESQEEGRFVRRGEGAFAEHWRSRNIPVTAHGAGPIEYLDALGVFGPHTLAIHAIDADAEDAARLAARGSSVVHCPKSNLKLGHGIAPVREFLDAGVAVGLGSDSVASSNAVDMFEEMRTSVFLQRSRLGRVDALGAHDALRMATLDGARCLGMDSEAGSLEPGKLANMILVDLTDPALQPVYDPVETMVYSAGRRNIRATFIGGERVAIALDAVTDAARAIAKRLMREVQGT